MKKLLALIITFFCFTSISFGKEYVLFSIPNSEEGIMYLEGKEGGMFPSAPSLACIEEEIICIHDPKKKEIKIYNYLGETQEVYSYTLENEFIPYGMKKLNEDQFVLWAHKNIDLYGFFEIIQPIMDDYHSYEIGISKEERINLLKENISMFTITINKNENTDVKEVQMTEAIPFYFYIDSGLLSVFDGNIILGDNRSIFTLENNVVQLKDIQENIPYFPFAKSSYNGSSPEDVLPYHWGYHVSGECQKYKNIMGNEIVDTILKGNIIYTLEGIENFSVWEVKKRYIEDIKKSVSFCFSDNTNISNNLKNIVYSAYVAGWITGSPDPDNEGEFLLKPNEKVNRAEFAKMLMLAFEKGEGDGGNLSNFPDIETEAWYIPFLSKAVETKTMKGYADSTMKPGNNISLAEGTKMVLEVLGVGVVPVQEGEKWHANYISVGKEMFPNWLNGKKLGGFWKKKRAINLDL